MIFDPLSQDEAWFYPSTDKNSIIPRNFKLAIEMRRRVTKTPHLEFVFYDGIENMLLVVEPIEVLGLLEITVEAPEGDRYLTSAIDVEAWKELKPRLVYVGVV